MNGLKCWKGMTIHAMAIFDGLLERCVRRWAPTAVDPLTPFVVSPLTRYLLGIKQFNRRN